MGTTTVPHETIAKDFRAAMAGKMEPALIDAAARKLVSQTPSYKASGSVMSAIFFLKFQITVDGGQTFNGKAGGVSSPGGGALYGAVFTDDLNALYANTKSFEFQGTSVNMSILFFDGSSNLLGHFEGGAVSTVNGIGGGRGEWD